MLFSRLKHYLGHYRSDPALKVSWSLYCFTTSICHGVENYFPRLSGTGISDAIFSHCAGKAASVARRQYHDVHIRKRRPGEDLELHILMYPTEICV